METNLTYFSNVTVHPTVSFFGVPEKSNLGLKT